MVARSSDYSRDHQEVETTRIIFFAIFGVVRSVTQQRAFCYAETRDALLLRGLIL